MKYDLEIIEDKGIQNICGRGKIIIKYNEKLKEDITSLELAPSSTPLGVAFFVNKIKNGFEVDISVNNAGTFVFHFLFNTAVAGKINF